MNLCMAASYDPDPAHRTASGCRSTWRRRGIEARWRRWLDTIRSSWWQTHRVSLKSLKGHLHDCGWRDSTGCTRSRILSKRLAEARIPHRYENSTTPTRTSTTGWMSSLPFLYRALSPSGL